MALVIDASVGLKWVLREPDSDLADDLLRLERDLLAPDFWLNEATNALATQVRRRVLTPEEARQALALLREQLEPRPTAEMLLHEVALDIGIAVSHPTYDTLYVAFAIASGADAVVTADNRFLRAMATHPDPQIAGMTNSLETWARSRGLVE